MKKIISLALAISMLFSLIAGLNISAYGAVSSDNNFEYEILDDGTASITKYLGTDATFAVPAKIDGYDVTEIGNGAFRSLSATQIYFGNEIRAIGEYAFADCAQLSSVFTIGNGLEFIGAHAFENCESLGYFDITDRVKSVGDYAFSGCTGMYALYLGVSLEVIGEHAYSGCVGLDMGTLTFPESLKSICANAFANVGNIDVSFLNTECNIDKSAFLGDSCTVGGYVGSTAQAFAYENGFDFNDISVPATVDDFMYFANGNGTAYISSYLGTSTNVIVPESIDGNIITEIRSGTFSNSCITKIIIPNSVEIIEEGAFNNCVSLKSIHFGSNLKSVDTSSLSFCPRLAEITVDENNQWYTVDNGVLFNIDKTLLVHYLRTKSNEIYEIPQTVKEIGANAFSYNEYLKDVVLPESVNIINEGAFEACSRLESVSLGNGVQTIKSNAFAYCKSLKCVDIPESVTIIENDAFNSCSALESVSLGNNVDLIGEHAFQQCSSLKSINIPDSVTVLGNYAFEYCKALESVTVGNGVEEIGYCVFSGCSSIENVALSDNVKSIGEDAFADCVSLKSIVLPKGVAMLKKDAFVNCNSIESIYVLNPNCVLGSLRVGNTFYGFAGSTAEVYANRVKKNFVAIPYAEFSGAAVTLYDDLTLFFKAKKADIDMLLENEHVSKVYAQLSLNGKAIAAQPVLNGEKYSFACSDIAPNLMNDKVHAELYINFDGIDVCISSYDCSVVDYALALLEQTNDAKLKTLLVNMLNYGAQSQIYTDYRIDMLANADLTEEQKSFGTAEIREFNSVTDTEYQVSQNQDVKWLSAGLILDENVRLRFKFSLISSQLDYLTMKITDDDLNEYIISANECVELGNNSYYIYFNGLDAGEMSKSIYVTMYANGQPMSNTLRYSIESYAAMAQGTDNEALKSLTASMMMYGDSANDYAN